MSFDPIRDSSEEKVDRFPLSVTVVSGSQAGADAEGNADIKFVRKNEISVVKSTNLKDEKAGETFFQSFYNPSEQKQIKFRLTLSAKRFEP